MTPTNMKSVIRDARKRAKNKGIDFTITVDDVLRALHEQNGRCAVSGVTFRESDFSPNPYGMSLDRIKSEYGYTPKNTRLVTHFVNNALSVWPDHVFKDMLMRLALKAMMNPEAWDKTLAR